MRMVRMMALAALGCAALACGPDDDLDDDGFPVPEDCDDADPEVHPSAVEVCNDVDDDCDGKVDPPSSEGTQVIWKDQDGDGWGDVDGLRKACDKPAGWVSRGGDCDDQDAGVNPDEGNCP